LLLKHRPNFTVASTGKFDLQLSGHSHGGQIFPFNLLTAIKYPLLDGLYRLADSQYLYTSRGTGTWGATDADFFTTGDYPVRDCSRNGLMPIRYPPASLGGLLIFFNLLVHSELLAWALITFFLKPLYLLYHLHLRQFTSEHRR
jgi:hypothetical protein